MLERACYVNLEAIWLMRKLRLEHKTNAHPLLIRTKFITLCLGSSSASQDSDTFKHTLSAW